MERSIHDIKYNTALSESGKLISVESAGKDLKYKCPGCGRRLILRNGEIRRKHFSHKEECNCSLETYLHKTAKFALYENIKYRISNGLSFSLKANMIKTVYEPITLRKIKDVKTEEYFEENILTNVSKVELETEYNGFIADVLLINNEEAYCFEIFVKHESELNKVERNTVIEIKIENEDDIKKMYGGTIEECDKVKIFNYKKRRIYKKILNYEAYEQFEKAKIKYIDCEKVWYEYKEIINFINYKNHYFPTSICWLKKINLKDKEYKMELFVEDNNLILRLVNGKKPPVILLKAIDNNISGNFDIKHFILIEENVILLNDFLISEMKTSYINGKIIRNGNTKLRCLAFKPYGHYVSSRIELTIQELYELLMKKAIELIRVEEILN